MCCLSISLGRFKTVTLHFKRQFHPLFWLIMYSYLLELLLQEHSPINRCPGHQSLSFSLFFSSVILSGRPSSSSTISAPFPFLGGLIFLLNFCSLFCESLIMVGFEGLGKERLSKGSFKKARSKDLKVMGKGCVGLQNSILGAYRSALGLEDLTYIQVLYGISKEFELELPGPDAWVDNSPLGQLRVYEEAFKVGLWFSIPPFVRELLRF